MRDLSPAKVLAGLYISTFLVRASFGLSWSILGHHLPSTGFGLGVVVSASALAELVAVVFVGVFIDRYGRRGMLLGGLLAGAASRVAIALTQSGPVVALLNAVYGLSAAAILVASLAMVTDHAPATQRGREMGAFDFSNIFGTILGYTAGLALLPWLGDDVRPAFLASGALGVVAFAYCAAFVVEHEHFRRRATGAPLLVPGSFRSVLTDRSLLLLTAPWFLVFFLLASFATFYPRVAATQFLDADDRAGFLSVAGWTLGVGVLVLATQVAYGRLSDRFGRTPIMLIGGVGFFGLASAIGLAVLAVPEGGRELTSLLLAWWPVHLLFLVMALAFGPSALASLADLSHDRRAGLTMGVYTMVVAAGMILGPPIAGLLADRAGAGGIALVFLGAATLILALVGLRAYLMWTRMRDRPRTAADRGATGTPRADGGR